MGVVLLMVVPMLVLVSPHYLTFDTAIPESDAVVLFFGPDMQARRQEAEALIKEGVADMLLTPTFGSIDPPSAWLNIDVPGTRGPLPECPKIGFFKNNRFCEDTHLEMLMTRRMMKHLGLRSAVLVSSPYHMRRIKIIAESVFEGDEYTLSYRPTRYEQTSPVWFVSKKDLKWVTTEYVKILWFLLYSRLM
mgnify:CR=1 FL=1